MTTLASASSGPRTASPRGVVALATVLLTGSGAAGQEGCSAIAGPSAAVSVAAVRVPVASGAHARGAAVGVAGSVSGAAFTVSAEAEYTILNDADARPLAARVRLGREMARVAGLHVCAGLLGGAVTTAKDEHSAWNLSGGLAAAVTRPFLAGGVIIAPYAGARGLAGRTSASVLSQEVVATGFSLGGEAGVAVRRGRAAALLRATADGFDAGLGATPYPSLAIRLLAGWSF